MVVILHSLPAWRALKKSFSPFDTQVPSQRTLILNIVNSFKTDNSFASRLATPWKWFWFPPSPSEQDSCRVGHHSMKASDGL